MFIAPTKNLPIFEFQGVVSQFVCGLVDIKENVR
jgi:hypothetical protein